MKTVDDAKRAVELGEQRNTVLHDLAIVKSANRFLVSCTNYDKHEEEVQLVLYEHDVLSALMIRSLERQLGEIDQELKALGIVPDAREGGHP